MLGGFFIGIPVGLAIGVVLAVVFGGRPYPVTHSDGVTVLGPGVLLDPHHDTITYRTGVGPVVTYDRRHD